MVLKAYSLYDTEVGYCQVMMINYCKKYCNLFFFFFPEKWVFYCKDLKILLMKKMIQTKFENLNYIKSLLVQCLSFEYFLRCGIA